MKDASSRSATEIPRVEDLKRPTLECLRDGVTSSDDMRERLARRFGLGEQQRELRLRSRTAVFTNNHAWALVRLQQDRLIRKVGDRRYALTRAGRASQEGAEGPPEATPPPAPGNMPGWAKTLIYRANHENGKRNPDSPPFTEDDFAALWLQWGGRCAITRLPFSEEKVGAGRAKRAFAPSLDRIDPQGPYSRENCRLVMVAVNFAINAWGTEVYLRLAKAASAAAQEASIAP